MKLYMKSLTLLLFLGTVASCNDSFLDQTQTSDLNRETVFADSTYTANFLTGIYTDIGFDINYNRWTYLLANGGGLQSACDEAEFYPSSTIWTNMMFATGTVNPVTVSDDAWSKCYTNIRGVTYSLPTSTDHRWYRAGKLNTYPKHFSCVPGTTSF